MTLLYMVFLRWAVTPSRPQKFAVAQLFSANICKPRAFCRCFAGATPLGGTIVAPGRFMVRIAAAVFSLRWRFAMPVLLGFILGVAVTILGVYEYDSTTGRAGNGLPASAAAGKAPMVNWDVVSEDWHNFQSSVRSTTDSIERKLKQHSG